MSKEPGVLPKLEILIFGVLFLAFLIWAVSKCSATRRAYQQEAEREEAELAELDSLDKAALKDMVPLDTVIKPLEKANPQVEVKTLPPLYIIVNGVNMRSGPGLNFKRIDRLKLHDVVYFTGEVTDTTQQIDLGGVVTDEPWVKVKNKKGQEGWIYGACVDYYKRELEGVETD